VLTWSASICERVVLHLVYNGKSNMKCASSTLSIPMLRGCSFCNRAKFVERPIPSCNRDDDGSVNRVERRLVHSANNLRSSNYKHNQVRRCKDRLCFCRTTPRKGGLHKYVPALGQAKTTELHRGLPLSSEGAICLSCVKDKMPWRDERFELGG